MQGGEVTRLWATVGADVTEFLNKMDQAERRANSTGKQIEKALGLFGISLTAYTTKKVAGYGVELAQLGAQAERTSAAFEILAGTAADRMLADLQVAARGTVSDMDLMASASKAMMLGVTRDSDEMGRLLEVARARGKAMGLSASEAFGDIVTGIGRMSPMILDNLGILTGGQKGFEEYAKSIGKSADALTDLEKRHYLLQKVLNDTTTAALQANDALDQAAQFEAVQARAENLKASIGQLVSRGGTGLTAGMSDFMGIGEFLDRIADIPEDTAKIMALYDAIYKLSQAQQITNEQEQAALGILDGMKAKVNALGISDADLAAGEQALIDLGPAFQQAMEGNAAAVSMFTDAEIAAFEAAQAMGEHIRWLGQWDIAIDSASDSMRKIDLLRQRQRVYAETEKEYWSLERQIRQLEQGQAGAKEAYLMKTMGPGAQLQFLQSKLAGATPDSEEYSRYQGEIYDLQKRMGDDAKRQQEELTRSLRSTVEGVLSPTSVSMSDMWRTKRGDYGGQWDEYIRRLRSAMQDEQSQWKHLVPEDVMAGGDIAKQGWFEEQQRAFYAGQLPEMIDWGAFDRQLQEEAARQQAREGLIQQAMARAGGTVSKGQAAALLGLPVSPGEALTADMGTAVAGVEFARPLVDALETQIKAEQEHIVEVGVILGGYIVKGASKSMTPQIGRQFARALWPYLADLLPEELP